MRGKERDSVSEVRSLGTISSLAKSRNSHFCLAEIGTEEAGRRKQMWRVYAVDYYSAVTKDMCWL